MNQTQPTQAPPRKAKRTVIAGVCFLLALYLFIQLLGLMFIQRIADRVAAGENVRIPASVRFMGFVADKLHDGELGVRLDPDGSNWPKAFTWFFVLEMCGLAGASLGLSQLGASILKQRSDWRGQAEAIIVGSIIAILLGFFFLGLIR